MNHVLSPRRFAAVAAALYAFGVLPARAAAPAALVPADGPAIGSQAPGFTLADTQGKHVSSADYRGQILVLNFWAFWCDTWKAETPQLRELAPRQDELGFRLVAVSVDGARLPEFQRSAHGGVPFPVLLDDQKQVSAQYHIAHVPTVVIVDRAGKVRYTARAYPGNYAILAELRKIASTGG
ncbi:thiol:disulfide interchange protein [Capsulimonas corticalis]|uniref:Thiol:disulfide interchange protein n=1 Tax=Capsulimonas corticalis TaxID=2219043 RepID=A0A402CZ05_9BACT|nr:TlpA disulfide reductase family protein [Capsulimonas corticalis]BDI29588.1 thiol:disulfide interchange protein [Capsulimonas corticalis]